MKHIYASVFFLLLISFTTKAEVTAWSIIPEQSALSFKAIQNNASITGQFKKFDGEILFDPNALEKSSVTLQIDISSLATSYQELKTTLMTSPWFDVNKFPQAIFKTTSFKKKTDKTFEVKGDLTLRDKTLPILLVFQLNEYSKDKAQATGHSTLKRTDFGVGQGWSKTGSVQDTVEIKFSLTAKRK